MSLINIIIYTTPSGKAPYLEWRDSLETNTRSIVIARIARIKLGNFGDCSPIKGAKSLWEFRIDHGPGYRIYFCRTGINTIIIFMGGEKKSQNRDITKSKQLLKEYTESSHE